MFGCLFLTPIFIFFTSILKSVRMHVLILPYIDFVVEFEATKMLKNHLSLTLTTYSPWCQLHWTELAIEAAIKGYLVILVIAVVSMKGTFPYH